MSKPKASHIIAPCSISCGADLAAVMAGVFSQIEKTAGADFTFGFIQGYCNGLGTAVTLLSDSNAAPEAVIAILSDAKDMMFKAFEKALSKEGGES